MIFVGSFGGSFPDFPEAQTDDEDDSIIVAA